MFAYLNNFPKAFQFTALQRKVTNVYFQTV